MHSACMLAPVHSVRDTQSRDEITNQQKRLLGIETSSVTRTTISQIEQQILHIMAAGLIHSLKVYRSFLPQHNHFTCTRRLRRFETALLIYLELTQTISRTAADVFLSSSGLQVKDRSLSPLQRLQNMAAVEKTHFCDSYKSEH